LRARRASHRVASRGRRKQIPQSDAGTDRAGRWITSGRQAGHGAAACWRARARASTSIRPSRILMPSPSNPIPPASCEPPSHGRGHAAYGFPAGAVKLADQARQCRGTDRRVGLHGGLDRVGRAAQASRAEPLPGAPALPAPAGRRLPAQSAADAVMHHACMQRDAMQARRSSDPAS
jgi:hypothetical protein